MFSASASYYDLIYAGKKDYRQEAREIAALIERLRPGARTVLDVGCGTAEHARLLALEHGYEVDGIDLEPDFIEIARAKYPAGRFVVADMRDFDLGRRYDVVLCLFSAIGYVKTLDGLARTLVCFRSHLADDGAVLVEPWFTPGAMRPGSVYMHTAETEDVKVCRMSRSDVEGRLSRLYFEYLVGRASGIERFSEVHELGLFTVEETTRRFREAGLTVRYREEGLTDRGLYTGRPAGTPPTPDIT